MNVNETNNLPPPNFEQKIPDDFVGLLGDRLHDDVNPSKGMSELKARIFARKDIMLLAQEHDLIMNKDLSLVFVKRIRNKIVLRPGQVPIILCINFRPVAVKMVDHSAKYILALIGSKGLADTEENRKQCEPDIKAHLAMSMTHAFKVYITMNLNDVRFKQHLYSLNYTKEQVNDIVANGLSVIDSFSA